MWTASKAQAHARLTELAEFFSGERALTRVGKDEQRLSLGFGSALGQPEPERQP